MILKRRDRRTFGGLVRALFYPRGGFGRAVQYVIHRMRRLPDNPHRIARGIFAGTFISFTPLFGVHILGAALVAWLVRGNILAAVLGTLIGNPLTFPFIAYGSIKLGHLMLGIEVPLDMRAISMAFANAGGELLANFKTLYMPTYSHWDRLWEFCKTIYFPYCVGGVLPGIGAGIVMHYVTLPLITAYQKMRAAKFKEKLAKNRFFKRPLAAMNKRRAAKAVGKVQNKSR
ncbi:MAG: hypothetical protein ACI9O0_000186 [Paracoccaceae bacterium]